MTGVKKYERKLSPNQEAALMFLQTQVHTKMNRETITEGQRRDEQKKAARIIAERFDLS